LIVELLAFYGRVAIEFLQVVFDIAVAELFDAQF